MIRGREAVARGLARARAPRPIAAGERIHVIGAAGAGASAAALLAHAAGGAPDGCDPGSPTPYTAPLEKRGIKVAREHDAIHVRAAPPARLAVTKALTSVHPDHPELVAAREAGVPVEAWQQTVADAAATQGGRLVAVAGTHGKSTSAGWLVHMLVGAGRDPGAFVGALMPAALTGGVPATARWGAGDAFVVEADEYAGNFDPYRPALAVVLNAEWDHPDVFADRSAVVAVFEAWLRAPGAGERQVVINTGDSGGAELAGRLGDWGTRVITVAPVEAAGSGVGYRLSGSLLWLSGLPGPDDRVAAPLRLPGAHNAANGACVAAAAAVLGLRGPEIADGLTSFEGVGRRFEIKGEPGGVLIIDDYGHHPTAIRATLEAVRSRYPGRPVWVAHEPLTFHRAAAMLDELAQALAEADHAVIADIWAGRDPDTSVATAAGLAERVSRISGRAVAAPGSPEETADFLRERVQPGDIVLAMGGGRSYVIADRLAWLLGSAGGQ
ncbi:MAG: cyanophycin synthetase [Candidatus Limnocylindrales bacterium]